MKNFIMKNIEWFIPLLLTYAIVILGLVWVIYKQRKRILVNTMECERVFDGRTEVKRCTDQNGDICYVTVYGISCNFKK